MWKAGTECFSFSIYLPHVRSTIVTPQKMWCHRYAQQCQNTHQPANISCIRTTVAVKQCNFATSVLLAQLCAGPLSVKKRYRHSLAPLSSVCKTLPDTLVPKAHPLATSKVQGLSTAMKLQVQLSTKLPLLGLVYKGRKHRLYASIQLSKFSNLKLALLKVRGITSRSLNCGKANQLANLLRWADHMVPKTHPLGTSKVQVLSMPMKLQVQLSTKLR